MMSESSSGFTEEDVYKILWLAGGRTQGISSCHLCKDLAVARFTQERVEAREVLPVCIRPEV